jgi:hypothetical protein
LQRATTPILRLMRSCGSAAAKGGAFEVELGQKDIDAAAASLKKLADRVDPARHGPPAVLAVITAWGLAIDARRACQ